MPKTEDKEDKKTQKKVKATKESTKPKKEGSKKTKKTPERKHIQSTFLRVSNPIDILDTIVSRTSH